MTRDDKRNLFVALVLLAAVFVGTAALQLICASAEAAAYERVTGCHVSAWDAIWLDLRVQEFPKD